MKNRASGGGVEGVGGAMRVATPTSAMHSSTRQPIRISATPKAMAHPRRFLNAGGGGGSTAELIAAPDVYVGRYYRAVRSIGTEKTRLNANVAAGYSYRNATIGSTFAARRAGCSPASTVTSRIAANDQRIVLASCGDSSNNCALSICV